jgi:serine/threonine protein kinase
MQDMFEKEVNMVVRLRHRNIVQLVAASITPKQGCIVMPFMDCSLLEVMTKPHAHPVVDLGNPVHRLRLLHDVASAMAYLHAGKPRVAHGDLQPSNIMVDRDGRAVIMDFGSATETLSSKVGNHGLSNKHAIFALLGASFACTLLCFFSLGGALTLTSEPPPLIGCSF